jgi:hypothetical protein
MNDYLLLNDLGFFSVIRIFGFAEDRLHLRKIQKYLFFRSVCTIFAGDYVQTDIQQAPSARVPTVRKQGLLAVQLSGQGGGV